MIPISPFASCAMRRIFTRIALLLMFASAIGCHQKTGLQQEVVYRLVDYECRIPNGTEPASLVTVAVPRYVSTPRSPSSIPSATILDDTRYVLAGHPRIRLARRVRVRSSQDRHISFRVKVNKSFPTAKSALFFPYVRLQGRRNWNELPAMTSSIKTFGRKRTALLEMEAPNYLPDSKLEVAVYARPPQIRTFHKTQALEIPSKASLEFAMGILEGAPPGESVRFVLEACRGAECERLFEETLQSLPDHDLGWQNRTVSLEPFAGQVVTFRFTTENLAKSGESLALPVWGNPTIFTPAQKPSMALPNIILISIDTLRRDHLDVYGYPRETAPFLRSAIAGSGAVFERLITEAATTDASHMTIFTSIPAMVHGAHGAMRPLAVPAITLAEVFRENGFETAAFTEDGPLAHDRGFSIGFNEYTENKSAISLRPRGQVERTFAQGRHWIKRNRHRPFFLFLHTFQVHAPYEPPEDYNRYFEASDVIEADNYDREIRYVDDELKVLYEWLDTQDLLANTVLFIIADHGEEFYEHGTLGHGTLPYEEVLRVPLIVHGPGVASGLRRHAPVHHLDLMPTILDVAGLPVPDQALGKSFAALLQKDAKEPDWEAEPIFSVTWALPPGLSPPALAVRQGNRKLIQYTEKDQKRFLEFDLSQDPKERQDMYAAEDASTQHLSKLLDKYQMDMAILKKSLSKKRALGRRENESFDVMDREREEKLRTLGYIQ